MSRFIFVGDTSQVFEQFGGIGIFRPSIETELEVRKQVERQLRKKHAAGTYTDATDINTILQDFFCFYDAMLKESLPYLASRDFMGFLLTQYDSSCELPNRLLSQDKTERWAKLGPVYRRAIKYLAECTAMLAPDESPKANKNEQKRLTEKCFICAEELVSYSELSSQTFILFPEDTTLEIRPEGELEWFMLSVDDADEYEGFRQRIATDTSIRKSVIDENKTLYDRERLARLVDPSFENEFGLTLTEVFHFVSGVIMNAVSDRATFVL